MGLDLYIEARIREKTTGRVISAGTEDRYAEDEDRGFFEICWWRGWIFADIRAELAAISNRHAGTHYTDSDFVIPVILRLHCLCSIIVSYMQCIDNDNL